MRTRGVGIAPWSFYKSDPLDNLMEMDNVESLYTIDTAPKKKKIEDAKNYNKINR